MLPNIIRNINAFFKLSLDQTPQAIHLSPPHEHLTSDLRTVFDFQSGRRTTFAWVGYGTYLGRSVVLGFITRFQSFLPTEEERKMADNYFSILGTHRTEIWFEDGLELGGGQPFTVGQEGHLRNLMHIVRSVSHFSANVVFANNE